jgi:NAD(P)-dependent dehydrogenase (short-subunit alcohol dehydrogenase family)
VVDRCVALVTGGGGELGRAIAHRLAGADHDVVVFERDEATAEALRDEMPGVLVIAADQTLRGEVDRAMAAVTERFGRLDVVVANAGYAKFGGFLEMEPRTWERHVAINLNGTFHICQAAARVMADGRRGGSIVVTASSLALRHADRTGAYCTTKAALLMLVQTMAAELGIHRIRANAVLPGVIETAMTRWMVDKPASRDTGGRRRGGGVPLLRSSRVHHRREPVGRWRTANLRPTGVDTPGPVDTFRAGMGRWPRRLTDKGEKP